MVAETDIADFDDHYRGYEIIFHDSRVSVILYLSLCVMMFLHICRNCETALINCLIVLIQFSSDIVVFICVCSIARTGC